MQGRVFVADGSVLLIAVSVFLEIVSGYCGALDSIEEYTFKSHPASSLHS
jgi:hypothetical protein